MENNEAVERQKLVSNDGDGDNDNVSMFSYVQTDFFYRFTINRNPQQIFQHQLQVPQNRFKLLFRPF